MVRTADAQWNGDLKGGNGTMRLGSGAFEGNFSFKSRMEDGAGTNPEELLGAAHAGCFSMALAATLSGAGFVPESVVTHAKVHAGPVEGGFAISKVELQTQVKVANIEAPMFFELAEQAKKNCPVSKALTGVEITLDAKMV